MGAVAIRAVRLARADVVTTALLATVSGALLILLVPAGGDAPAHLYRTLLVRDGVHIWDNLWYEGQYPLASYSLLYYLPAAFVGNVPLVFASVIASAALFASLALREWGRPARWPARAFGVLASAPLFTGTYAYALGLASLLAVLRALQAGNVWLAVLAAALTLGFSPLAFVFLCLVLVAVALARRPISLRPLGIGLALLLLTGLEAAALAIFPDQGIYPFNGWDLWAVLTVCAFGAALARRVPRGNAIVAFFALWALLSLTAFLAPSPFGDNVTRLRQLVFPLMLLVAFLARFRPRWLAATAVFLAFAYNVVPYIATVPFETDARAAKLSFWAPAIAFLRQREPIDFRVEVVPTSEHWEAYWLPRAGFALARGWYRQLDFAENPLLYGPVSPPAYRAWLRAMGVRYVLLPRTDLDPMGAQDEAKLLRSGHSGLTPVLSTGDGTIYEVPRPVPILTGPARAGITAFEHERIAGWMGTAGSYLLRVRYTPYWQVRQGAVCLAPGPAGMTRLEARHGGPFLLVLPEEPEAIVRDLVGEGGQRCPQG